MVGVSSALCLAGEPRDLHVIFDDFRSKVDNWQSNTFVHTWLNVKGSKTNLPSHTDRGGNVYDQILNVASTGGYVDSLLSNKFLSEDFYLSDPFLKFKNTDAPTNITRMHSMFYSIQKSFELALNSSCDVYIRARPDLFLEYALPFDMICDAIKQNPRLVVFPDLFFNVGNYYGTWSPDGDYIPDFLWFGSRLMAEAMLHIYDDIDKHCGCHRDISINQLGNWPSVPEHYLMRWLKVQGFHVAKISVRVMLGRQYIELKNTGKVYI